MSFVNCNFSFEPISSFQASTEPQLYAFPTKTKVAQLSPQPTCDPVSHTCYFHQPHQGGMSSSVTQILPKDAALSNGLALISCPTAHSSRQLPLLQIFTPSHTTLGEVAISGLIPWVVHPMTDQSQLNFSSLITRAMQPFSSNSSLVLQVVSRAPSSCVSFPGNI